MPQCEASQTRLKFDYEKKISQHLLWNNLFTGTIEHYLLSLTNTNNLWFIQFRKQCEALCE